ncbi:MFS transporter [Plantactinospora siamensis]|uniref:MFS transporter n=1 Tax=Plantactinospora siamensis TaxID=555372 RepID=A0ABV6NTX2_9ACTN
MMFTPYRPVLALPSVRPLLLVAMLARVPTAAAGVTLTLHVVLDLHRGYAAAGLVGAAMTVGTAIGAPLLGRLVDRRGLRPVLLLTTLVEAAFWATAQAMPYRLLLAAAFVGGLCALPVFSVVRQSLAALTPERHRRQAYALDSMSVELSFMTGPALAVFLATTVSARVTMLTVGAGVVAAGTALLLLNPPVRAAAEPAGERVRVRRRDWLAGRLLAVLVVSAAGTLVLGGTDVSVVAMLRGADQVGWTGAVLALWGGFSLIGGFAYGALHRAIAPAALTALLCLLTIPVGLSGGRWWLLALALLPAGALCAPTLAATADAVSRLVPPSVRGEAMGLHGSAITVGIALGAPLAGAVIDASGPAWGFAATGAVGLLAVLASRLLPQRRPPAEPSPDPHRPARPSASPSIV